MCTLQPARRPRATLKNDSYYLFFFERSSLYVLEVNANISLSLLLFFGCISLVAGSVLLSTMAACYVIIVQILHNLRSNDGHMAIPQTGFDAKQLLLSFGTLMFSFGGTVAFPAIQNNVFKRNEYSRSVLVSFMSEYNGYDILT